MKTLSFGSKVGWLAAFLAFCAAAGHAQTNFNVTSPDYIYAVDNLPATGDPGFFTQNSPTLDLVAGNTYTFAINTDSVHPVVIVTNPNGFPPDGFAYSGATPQDINTGTITLTIPTTDFPTTLYYECDFHGFYGVINVHPAQSPLPPPSNIIISLSVGANVVMRSTGTNTTYGLVPQFSSNLVTWLPVPSYTNTFSNGTNVTSFNRLEPICGPNVFLRVSQQSPP